MKMREAFRETLDLAKERGMPLDGPVPDTGLAHLSDMSAMISISPWFSDGKLGRWLGWAQACVVMSGVATLEEMKQLNMRHSE